MLDSNHWRTYPLRAEITSATPIRAGRNHGGHLGYLRASSPNLKMNPSGWGQRDQNHSLNGSDDAGCDKSLFDLFGYGWSSHTRTIFDWDMLLHLCASYVILVEKCVMRCGRCDSFRIGAFASATASNYLLTYFLSLIIFVSLLLIRTVRAADRIALSFLQAEHEK